MQHLELNYLQVDKNIAIRGCISLEKGSFNTRRNPEDLFLNAVAICPNELVLLFQLTRLLNSTRSYSLCPPNSSYIDWFNHHYDFKEKDGWMPHRHS